MTLHDYLNSKSLSDAEMAITLGCSEGAVRKWRYGQRTPRIEQMRKIQECTDGLVSPNDFLTSYESATVKTGVA